MCNAVLKNLQSAILHYLSCIYYICFQEIVGIETPAPAAAAAGQPIESGRLCVLGTVKHRMTASQDIESLVAAYRR